MEIAFRPLLPFLLFYVFKGSLAQTDVVTYTSKSVEKLECSFTSTIVQWTEQQDDGNAINLFLYDVTNGLVQKQTNDSKYDNFNYSVEGTNGFNLVITNVDKGDGGRYQCIRITSSAVTFDVTVEVLPESISIHCTGLNVCMPSAERENVPQINCVCTATGFISSALELEWEGVGTPITSNTSRVMNHTSGSFNISSKITFPPPDGTSSISCSLTGYRSQIPERFRSSTYTFSQPECKLVHECLLDGTNASLICSCSKGSPKVNAYIFYNSQKSPIGTQHSSSKSVQVETNTREIFYCSGCNGVSHNQIVRHEFNCKQGSAWWIIIVILLLLVVAAVIFLVVKKPWLKGKGVGPRKRKEGEDVNKSLLRGNTSVEEGQKVQEGPRGKEAVSSGGDQAPHEDKKLGGGSGTDPKADAHAKEEQLEAGESEVDPEDIRNKVHAIKEKLEAGESEVDPEDIRNKVHAIKEKFEEGGSGALDPKDYRQKAHAKNEKLEAGESEVDPEDIRNKVHAIKEELEAGESEVDPEDIRNKVHAIKEDKKQDIPPTKERTPGDGKEGAKSAEAMNREKATPHNQGTSPNYSSATQKYDGRQGGNNDMGLLTGHHSQYMSSPTVDSGLC